MNKSNKKGITLIALVVTIVVLLILAGVTISMLSGNNGIITQAQNAKEQTEITRIKEEAELVKGELMLETLSDLTQNSEIERGILLKALNEHFEGSKLENNKIITSNGKYDVIVDEKLNITVVKRQNTKQGMIITAEVVEKSTGEKGIRLYFEINGQKSGMQSMLDYIDEVESGKNATDLEKILEDITDGTDEEIVFNNDVRKEVEAIGWQIGMTYEQTLRYFIIMYREGVSNVQIISAKAMYNYYCEYLDIEPSDDATTLESQYVEATGYDGTFEEALNANMQYTREQAQQEAINSGLTYEIWLQNVIAMTYDEENLINGTISTGETFETSVATGQYVYPVTENGSYEFSAIGPKGETAETTVVVGDNEQDITSDPNGWEVAWTYSADTGWSDIITNEGKTVLQGDITAKFYNTGKTITPVSTDGTIFENGPEYKLVIEGSGDMGSLLVNDFVTWQNYGAWGEYSPKYPLYTTEATICDGITSTGDFCFFGFVSLETAKISNTVTTIGKSLFDNCCNLKNVTIPQNITTISQCMFAHCSSLEQITIPETVTSIDYQGFLGCSSLINLTIPENVKTIGSMAFQECSGLTEIVIPDGVEIIEDYTFEDATNLKQIIIPKNVTKIGLNAFRNCSSLNAVTILGDVTEIDGDAFTGIASGAIITVPNQTVKNLFEVGINYDSTTTITY